jgi:hypothetical protein
MHMHHFYSRKMSTVFGEMGADLVDLSEEDIDFNYYHTVMDTMPEQTTIIEQLDAYYDTCSIHDCFETEVPFFRRHLKKSN